MAIACRCCKSDILFCEEWDEEGGSPAGAEDEDGDG